jgi:hypothetical protein
VAWGTVVRLLTWWLNTAKYSQLLQVVENSPEKKLLFSIKSLFWKDGYGSLHSSFTESGT